MTNRRRKAETRAMLAQAETDEKLRTPRHIDAELWYPGAGQLLVRLAWLPSFEPPMLWEVRSAEGVLVAFRSVGTDDSEYVTGHEKLAVADAVLRDALDEIAAHALPLTPNATAFGVADGETYVATIHSGPFTGCRFSWVAEGEPRGWSPVVNALLRLRGILEGTAPPLPARSLIYCVQSRSTSARLVRLETGEFQVWEAGVLGSLVCGYDHILTTEPLASALAAACGDDVELKPARVVRKSTQEAWSYVEVIPRAELSGPDDLPQARRSDTRAWRYAQSHLFVKAEVRASLAKVGFDDLEFSLGFGQFGGLSSY